MDPKRILSDSGAGPPAAGEMGDEDLLNAVAQRIVRMGMAVPAVFFIESTKPLSFVGSQVLVFLEPFVSAFLTIRNYQRFTRLMEDRKNLETLIQRIETLDEEARRAEKERKAEAKRRRAEEKARKRGETSRG
jgi:hypothetical protein